LVALGPETLQTSSACNPGVAECSVGETFAKSIRDIPVFISAFVARRSVFAWRKERLSVSCGGMMKRSAAERP